MRSKQTLLFESPTVRILDYRCHEQPNGTSPVEVSDTMEIAYTRSGHFFYRGHKQQVAIDNTLLLLKNEGSEHVITHDHVVRDTCTAFQFSKTLLENYAFPVAAIAVTPQWDYLHAEIFRSLISNVTHEPSRSESLLPETLKIDVLSVNLLNETLRILTSNRLDQQLSGGDLIRARYREAIERAKLFILENSKRDISLKEIARHAYISEFHFSRIFRLVTGHSPHQYLLTVRFQNAALLLRETSLRVTDVCFASGFNSLPHFIAAFTRRFKVSPRKYRNS